MMTTVGLAPEIKNLRYLMSLENHVRARASGGGSEESQNVPPSQDKAVEKTHARIRGRRILGGLFGRDFGRLIRPSRGAFSMSLPRPLKVRSRFFGIRKVVDQGF